MSLTNAQVALQAASSQVTPGGTYTLPSPDGQGMVTVNFDVATRQLAAGYTNWLNQQDQLTVRLTKETSDRHQ